jgi:23S rRNA (pseudouridine1915-N3)-methyltransferase
MRAVVLLPGKLRDAAIEGACAEYAARSRATLPVELSVCRDRAAQWARARALGGPVVVLDERGEHPSSTDLAGWLAAWRDRGVRAVAFLVGDAHGFADEDRRAAERVLALSRLTLPHRLAVLVLCEQLYRSATILAGHPYHHG